MTSRTTVIGVYRGLVDNREVEIEIVEELADGLVRCEVNVMGEGLRPMNVTIGRDELDRMVQAREVDWVARRRKA